MIDLDEEQARMESMLDRRERMAIGVTCTEMIELITRLRQAEKDAARYRDEIEAARFDIGNLSTKLERADSVIFEVERVLSESQRNCLFEHEDLLSEAQYYINNHQGVNE